jgi:hypothetical protein
LQHYQTVAGASPVHSHTLTEIQTMKFFFSAPWWYIVFAPLFWAVFAPFLSLCIVLWPKLSLSWVERKELVATLWWIPTIVLLATR